MLKTTFEGGSMSLHNGSDILVIYVSLHLCIADHASANGPSILHNILSMDEGHGVLISPFCASGIVLHEGCTLYGISVGPNWVHAQCTSALCTCSPDLVRSVKWVSMVCISSIAVQRLGARLGGIHIIQV